MSLALAGCWWQNQRTQISWGPLSIIILLKMSLSLMHAFGPLIYELHLFKFTLVENNLSYWYILSVSKISPFSVPKSGWWMVTLFWSLPRIGTSLSRLWVRGGLTSTARIWLPSYPGQTNKHPPPHAPSQNNPRGKERYQCKRIESWQ
jgi:hypothetical protein